MAARGSKADRDKRPRHRGRHVKTEEIGWGANRWVEPLTPNMHSGPSVVGTAKQGSGKGSVIHL